MSRKYAFFKGALILTLTGVISRCIGFGSRIFLSQAFGAEGLGLYQLIFPVFALIYSFTTTGIETAISRSTSSKFALGKYQEARHFLFVSTTFSFALSMFATFLLQQNAALISTQFLGDSRTYKLLLIMSYTFPFASVHSCIIGYFLGQKKTAIPALTQLTEQFTRVLSIVLLYYIYLSQGRSTDISLAVIGLVVGDMIATIFTLLHITKHQRHLPPIHMNLNLYFLNLKELLPIAGPLTANRVILNLLRSIEAISIPLKLQEYGNTLQEALSTYGVLTGMALPCLLFPTAITSSVSALLLPTVAEIQALNNKKEIKLVVQKTLKYCFLLGFACLISFFIFSDMIGNLLFHNAEAGSFLKVLAWLCPFLYLNTTLLSIVNGLGHPTVTFILNSLSLLLRIGCIYFFIPIFGIYGYLCSLLFSEIFVTVGCLVTFRKLCIV